MRWWEAGWCVIYKLSSGPPSLSKVTKSTNLKKRRPATGGRAVRRLAMRAEHTGACLREYYLGGTVGA